LPEKVLRNKVNKKKKGIFIVIEGIDGSGKTTLSYLLKDYLTKKGFDVVQLKEPTDSYWGKKIKEIQLNGRGKIRPEEELNLFMEDRKFDIEKNIIPNLKKGKIVILDRYFYSTIAYQGALGLNYKWIKKINEESFPLPDIVIYLKIDPKKGLKRITKNRGDEPQQAYEKVEYLEKVKRIFDDLAKKDKRIKTVEADTPIEKVFEESVKIISKIL